MDLDTIFVIILYLCMLFLSIGSIIALSRKIWRTKISMILKLLIPVILVGLLIIALLLFDTVETSEVKISRWEVMIYSASIIIGLNLSLNLNRKKLLSKIKVASNLKVIIITIMFAIFISSTFYFTANLFDKLNILGGTD
jgi:4-amino-4-deoxy-L-arabinose transferase-like glycosyltransferase